MLIFYIKNNTGFALSYLQSNNLKQMDNAIDQARDEFQAMLIFFNFMIKNKYSFFLFRPSIDLELG